MERIVFDNAGISSVLRALGFTSTNSQSALDVDQAALEQFCEAVLLADQVIIPDNYKDEFQESRKNLLDHPSILHAKVAPEEDKDLIGISARLSQAWFDAFEAGSERGTFSQYFKQTKAFADFIWEYSSSEFFLVFRAVGVNKASPLIDAFLNGKTDTTLAPKIGLFARDGKEVDHAGLSPHVTRLLGILAWLGSQYIWYQVYAAAHGSTYMPHPLREFFAFDFMERLKRGSKTTADFARAFLSPIRGFQSKLKDHLAAANIDQSISQMSIPPLIPIVLKNSTDGQSFLSNLFTLRDNQHTKDLRAALSQSRRDQDAGRIENVRKLSQQIDRIGGSLLKEQRISTGQLSLKPPLSLMGVGVSGDDLGLPLPVPATLYKQFFLTRRYRVFVRDVMEELAFVSKLGTYKDTIDGFARVKERRYPPFYVKPATKYGLYHKPLNTSSRPKGSR